MESYGKYYAYYKIETTIITNENNNGNKEII